MNTLRLFPSETDLCQLDHASIAWRILETRQVGNSTLAQLPAAQRIELYLPSPMVLRTSAQLPVGAAKQARKLLPFALDQVLLDDANEQAIAHRFVDEQCRIAAVQRARLKDILDQLDKLGRRPRSVMAIDALIPADGLNLLWCGNGWARRVHEKVQWFDAASPSLPPDLLKLAALDPQGLSLCLTPGMGDMNASPWQQALQCPVSIAGGDPLLGPVAADAIELLQGEFASGPQFDFDWSRLKPSLVLAGTALIMLGIIGISQLWQQKREETRLKLAMTDAYKQAFPNEPLIDPQLQLQSKLQKQVPAAVDAGSLSPLLQLAPRLAAGGGVKLQSVQYSSGKVVAEYQGAAADTAAFAASLQPLGQVQTTPVADNRLRISINLSAQP